MNRGAGILLHVTSLPSGDFKSAHAFVDFLVGAGVKYWQVLAFGPTGYGDSPYAPLSAFAINSKFTKEYKKYSEEEVKDFVSKNKFWIESYAAYMTIRDAHEQRGWLQWPIELQDYSSSAVKSFVQKHQEQYDRHIQVQINLYEQWIAIKNYANDRGVQVIGDLPIYPSMDSADVWANRNQFQFEGGLPVAVAGVGPDYFNKEGQHWGNPLYNFSQMARDKYKWWIAYLRKAEGLYDIIRIDHFRAFDSYYKIPYGAKSALEGTWAKGPGLKFFNAVNQALPDIQVIVEDLGNITASVASLREKTGYPGMRVMQFGFSGKNEDIHLPKNYPYNCIAYIGTHDNDTFVGFLKSLNEKDREIVDDYLNSHFLSDEDMTRLAIEDVLSSQANIVILCMQDLLFQDAKHRMNRPGTVGGNWKYRVSSVDLSGEVGVYLRLLIERSRRL